MRMSPRDWSIRSLLIALAIAPVLVMLAALVSAMFLSAQKDLKADIDEKGQLVAAALAESSQYGVISENRNVLEQTMRMLAATDKTVVRLAVLNIDGEILASFQVADSAGQKTFEFSHPISSQPVEANYFDSTTQLHMPQQSSGVVKDKKQEVLLGRAIVVIGAAPFLTAKHRAIYSVLLLASVAAFCGGVFGLVLAKRIEQPLREVMRAMMQIRQGQYNVEVSRVAGGELGELQEAVVDMSRALSSQWQWLESKVEQRTKELQKANLEKGKLIAHSNMMLESERKRIALDIHDQLNPSLIAIRLAASALAANDPKSLRAEEVKKLAGDIFSTADEIYANARRIVKSLRPEIMDTLGFNKALAELVRQFNVMQKHCCFDVVVMEGTPNLNGDVAITAYRVIQEGLSNIVKHAQATEAMVTVDSAEAGKVRVVIRDNGKGFDVNRGRGEGVGLIGVNERVAHYGGSFSLKSGPAGTILCAEFPVS